MFPAALCRIVSSLLPAILACVCYVPLTVAFGFDSPVQDENSAASDQREQDKLDPRIDSSKITEVDPPPLPESVVQPMPATHRIATRPEEIPISQQHWEKARQSLRKGLEYLRQQQGDSGAWMKDKAAAPTDQPDKPSPIAVAVTALGVKAFIQSDKIEPADKTVRKALTYIMRSRDEDGSFGSGSLANYVTSAVVSALSGIDELRYHDALADGVDWLKKAQWDQSEGLNPRQDWFGGAGYGSHGRPDLSNTQMMLDALYDAGVSPEDPNVKKAIMFLSRTQNLSKTNKAEWAGDDGGFIYTPANGGESMASQAADEGRYGEKIPEGQPRSLRSYGSMTYAGFKSMLYAGMSADDIRVRAAFDWIRKHYTFDENPGLGRMGLYYYYFTMARALRIAQQAQIEDEAGQRHNWREDLIDALAKRQRTDGSWVNSAERWMEDEPELVTIYSVLALEAALKPTLHVTQ